MNKYFILDKLPQNKASHFLLGFILFMCLQVVFSDTYSLLIVLMTSLIKEVYDYKNHEKYDILDALTTLAPGIIITSIR